MRQLKDLTLAGFFATLGAGASVLLYSTVAQSAQVTTQPSGVPARNAWFDKEQADRFANDCDQECLYRRANDVVLLQLAYNRQKISEMDGIAQAVSQARGVNSNGTLTDIDNDHLVRARELLGDFCTAPELTTFVKDDGSGLLKCYARWSRVQQAYLNQAESALVRNADMADRLDSSVRRVAPGGEVIAAVNETTGAPAPAEVTTYVPTYSDLDSIHRYERDTRDLRYLASNAYEVSAMKAALAADPARGSADSQPESENVVRNPADPGNVALVVRRGSDGRARRDENLKRLATDEYNERRLLKGSDDVAIDDANKAYLANEAADVKDGKSLHNLHVGQASREAFARARESLVDSAANPSRGPQYSMVQTSVSSRRMISFQPTTRAVAAAQMAKRTALHTVAFNFIKPGVPSPDPRLEEQVADRLPAGGRPKDLYLDTAEETQAEGRALGNYRNYRQ